MNKKRVLLVTQYFFPEDFKSNDIAFELQKRGFEVTVLTGIPNYPQGRYFKGYGVFKRRREEVNGVKIKRAFLTPRGNSSGFKLALNYFSWAFFASIKALFLALKKRFDVIIVHEPSPITQGFPAIMVKKIQKIPILFWVLDLWPESLTAAGGVKNKIVINFFTKIARYVYRKSDKLLIGSKMFKESILDKGNFESKIIYFPNWVEDVLVSNQNNKLSIPEIPKGFRIMFTGNIGESQDFDSIMNVALLLKEHKEVKWILVGDGRKKKWVEDFIVKHDLIDTVFLLGRFPIEYMPLFFRQANALLITLKDQPIFSLTVPTKLQAYMSSSRPILAMLNGEGAQIIKEADCGYVAPAGDYKMLSDIIVTKVLPNKNDFSQKGLNGFHYYKKYFRKETCFNNLCQIINDTIQ